MTYIIDRINAVAEEPVRIGDADRPRSTRPITLPAKLDAAACLAIIERVDPNASADKIAAGTQKLDTSYIDEILEYADLNLDDRFRFKSALTESGLMSRGRLLNR